MTESVDIKDISGHLLLSTSIGEGSKRKFYLMKEDYITLKFSVENPVYFELGDYCEIDEGLFEVVDLVFPTRNQSTSGYDYELRLDAPYWKWKHKILFYDRQGNKEAAWNLTRNPEAHMSIVISNLSSLGYTYKGLPYDFSIDYNVVEDKPIFLQYSKTNIIDAITMIAEACECEWWVVGYTIYLGKCELPNEPITFELENNVKDMTRDKSDSTYATRIYAFGSTRNITPYYRKNLIFEVTGKSDYNSGDGTILTDMNKPLKAEYFLDSTKENVLETKGIPTVSKNGLIPSSGKASVLIDLPSIYTQVRYDTLINEGLNVHISLHRVSEADGAFSATQINGRVELETVADGASTVIQSFENTYKEEGVYKIDISNTSIEEFPDDEEIKLKFSFSISPKASDVDSVYQITVGGSIGMKGKSNNRLQVKFLSGKFEGRSFDALLLGYNQELFIPGLEVNDIVTGIQYKLDKLKYDKIPSGWFTSDHADADLVVEGIVEKRLMLPAGTPFIGDTDLPTEKVIEQVVVFEDIYPKRVGNVGTVTTHQYTGTTEDENGNVISEEKWDAYRFTDTDENFHFSKDYVIKEKDLKITFQTGALAGMTFNVWFNPYDDKSSDKKEDEKNPDGTWNPSAQVFEIVRNEDYGRKLPAGDMKPRGAEYDDAGNVAYAGDEYTLEGFDTQFVSDAYVPASEQELKEKAQKYADKLKIDPSVYNNKLFSYEDGRYANLPLGQKINLVNDTYFNKGRQSRIVGFEKNLDIPYDSPVYMVGESQTYSRIGALEDKVDALTFKGLSYTNKANSGNGSSVYVIKRNDNTPAGDNNVYSALRSSLEFLSKKNPDTAAALIKFTKGISVDGGANIDTANITEAEINILDVLDRFSTKDGKFFGKLYSADYVQAMIGWIINSDGTAEMKGLRLREFLEVPELRYNRISVITGEQWSAPGGGIIESVDTNNCLLYLKLEPGELAAVEIDDICKGTFNNDTGFRTAFFRITEKLGDSTFKYALRSGYTYHPQKAMHFVTYGSFTNKDRQASAYITLKYTRYLRGVNTWEIGKNMIVMQFGDLSNLKAFGIDMEGYSAYLKNIYLTGTIKQLSSDGVTETPVPAFKGEWNTGTYYPNDEVTHNGSTWLCISEKKTAQEPAEDATDWLETSAKGKDAIVVELFSSNGNIFRNGQGGTTLTAHVRKGEKDVTDGIPLTRFSWEKESDNPDTDKIFNETHVGHGHVLTLTPDDVWGRATFNCIVNL